MVAYPQRYEFSHPDAFIVPVSNGKALVGRIVARNIDMGDKVIEVGTVLTVEDIEELSKSDVEMISVYGGIVAQKVKLTGENVNAVLNFGGRLYCFGRLTENGKDVFYQDELVVDRYIPDTEQPILDNEARTFIYDNVQNGAEYSLYLVGSANQVIFVKNNAESDHVIKIVGNDPLTRKKTIIISDMYAQYSYLLNRIDDVGTDDDIDHLGNRRIRTVGELIQTNIVSVFQEWKTSKKECLFLISAQSQLKPDKYQKFAGCS